MNRLILIGNGFDLALGLKTSYSDFLVWLIKKYISNAHQNRGKQIQGIKHINGYYGTLLFSVEWTQSLVFEIQEFNSINSLSTLNSFKGKYSLKLNNESTLFKRIMSHAGKKGWVDIENTFYQLLTECLKPNRYTIADLNKELDFLKNELEEYLTIVDELPKDFGDSGLAMGEQLNKKFNTLLVKDPTKVKPSQIPERLVFIDFNYTSTASQIAKHLQPYSKSRVEVIPLHGRLNDKTNPMIFGFGDEIDKNYTEIEERNDNRFFKHIKSFKYLRTNHYHNLMRLIDSSKYQVFIYGHSCGLSDRTMLREVFEHENCKSIKTFYYKKQDGSDDFEDKTMEISRHFTDKALMRRKVVNKSSSYAIPQNNRKVSERITVATVKE